MNVTVHSYNTQLIKKEELPKSFYDLLDPRWKGKLGIESKAEEWYSKVISVMGEEKGLKYFRELVAKNGMSARLGASLLHNLVIAGEVPMALTVYIDLPEKDKRAGKPVDWFALDPVVAQGFNVSIAQKHNIRTPRCSSTITCYRLKLRNYWHHCITTLPTPRSPIHTPT